MSEPRRIVLVGTNHRHAPIDVRERLAVHEHGQVLVGQVLAHPEVEEAVAVATCNRCELVVVGDDPDALVRAALEPLAAASGQPREALADMVYVHRDEEAARHLFAVAGGLDSMVPGEAQILAQIRDAHAVARGAGTTGPVTNRLFHHAVEAGKRVRSETSIGSGGASVPSVAADLVRRTLGALDGLNVVLVGAGRVAEKTAAALATRGAPRVVIVNRDLERGRALAARVPGEASAVGLDGLGGAVRDADVVVSSTSSPGLVLRPADVPPGRPRVLVDLAVPRDIDPALTGVPGVTLVNVDDLQAAVRATIRLRQGEVSRARGIVAEEAAVFRARLAELGAVPAITSLRALAEEIRIAELRRMEPKWEALSDEDRARVDAVTRGVINKLLHRPTVRLKERAAQGADDYARALGELFDL